MFRILAQAQMEYVFIPQLSEDILPIDIKNIKIKPKERFIEAVKSINCKYIKKDDYYIGFFNNSDERYFVDEDTYEKIKDYNKDYVYLKKKSDGSGVIASDEPFRRYGKKTSKKD